MLAAANSAAFIQRGEMRMVEAGELCVWGGGESGWHFITAHTGIIFEGCYPKAVIWRSGRGH